ncbi:hypothetical protein CGLO_01662 [Colletotrichum gloeosporioides Cg-14]|uniref:TAM domain methyltransferase n=1 Tax=Colletotrichum gloeosporioides (strain Cg-14) TaxID=1237896 RepID=T0L0Z5_COLGC|nr:hypothetical protein CGLO_01662 [Colletotrichum gloeosporioides Cg-14]
MCQDSLVNDGPDIAAGENDTDDTTSDLAVSVASSTTSIASSVLRFRIENGRTYHSYKEGEYSYSNDEKENERLDLQHNLMLLTLHEKLGLAPPNNQDYRVKRVLDVGTGTGLWAIDFADEHPDAEVLGTDLSPVQTTHVPPNAKFEIDDVEEPWTDDHHKLLGEWTEENFMEGIEAWTLAPLTRALEWTREEVLVFLTQARKELRDRIIRAYLLIFVIHGRKPLQAGDEGEQ